MSIWRIFVCAGHFSVPQGLLVSWVTQINCKPERGAKYKPFYLLLAGVWDEEGKGSRFERSL